MDLEDGGKVQGFHRREKEASVSAVTSGSILEERLGTQVVPCLIM